MTNIDPTLASGPETLVTSEKILERLTGMDSETQYAFYESWLDKTVPGRITATVREASKAAVCGDRASEQILCLQAALELQAAVDYAERESKSELTAEELATKEALGSLFPDKWPFDRTK